MRNGKLNKTETRALIRAWEITEKLSDYKKQHDENDNVLKYSDKVSNAIMWLLGELKS